MTGARKWNKGKAPCRELQPAHAETHPPWDGPMPYVPEKKVEYKLNEGSTWDYYPDPYAKTPEQLLKEQTDKAIADYLEFWPWVNCPQKLMTIGPYALNYAGHMPLSPEGKQVPQKVFTLPQQAQNSKFIEMICYNRDVWAMVLDTIFQNHSSAWKLWATCQEMMPLITQRIDLWDMAGAPHCGGGSFNNCEKDREGPNAPVHPLEQGSVSSVVVISPLRRIQGPPSYNEQVKNLYTMSIAMKNFAGNMQNLQIHRIGFLTPQLLALLVPKMTNLKVLGIYQCQLLNVSEIFRLLEIIKIDRPPGRENQISLDFFPLWHQGPRTTSDGTGFPGCYGVTWDNTNSDHCLAIWAIVVRLFPIALAQGIDLFSKGRAFRQWLDKGLLWKVEKTLAAIQDPRSDPRVIAALVDSRNPDHGGNWRRFASNSVIGCRPEGYEPYVKKYRCNYCKVKLLGIFYKWHDLLELQAFNDNDTRNANLCCYGCNLKYILLNEKDHNKSKKRYLMRAWLRGKEKEWNSKDIHKALRDFYSRDIIRRAVTMDTKRLVAMSSYNRDVEYAEHQARVPYEKYGKHGWCQRSPTANLPEKVGPLNEWESHSMDNRNAHRRY